MALLQHDGFDHYGAVNLNSATQAGSIQWVSGGYEQPTYTLNTNPAYGKNAGSLGLGFTAHNNTYTWVKKAIRPESNNTGAAWSPDKRLVLGFAARFPLALTGNMQILRIGGISVNIASDWFIYVDGVQTSYQCELNIWNFIEVVFDLEANKFRLYMTDVLVLEKDCTAPVLDFYEVRAGIITGSGQGQILLHVDDLYLLDGNPLTWDGKTTSNVDRIGKCNTLTRYPTADSTVQMLPLSGSTNFNMVNQATPDGDTSYVSSNVPGATDLYTNLTAFTTVDDAAIRAVTIAPSVRMLEPDSLSVTAVIKVDDAEAAGYRMKLKAATYSSEKHIFENSPKTNAPWTPTEALNMKFGHRLLPKPS